MDHILLEILIITLLAFFQSIFGIGLLLYGTPIFLILGNDFLYSLNILLPVSMTISLMQLRTTRKIFKFNFIKLFILITLPVLIFTLFLLIKFYESINIKLLVSFVIIFFSLSNLIFNKFMNIFFRVKLNQYFVFFCIGIVHGLTNLGGSLLAISSSQINFDKNNNRICIAFGYFSMGLLQLLLIYLLSDTNFDFLKLFYIIIPILIYNFSQKYFFKLSNIRFSKILNLITFVFGVYLFLSIS